MADDIRAFSSIGLLLAMLRRPFVRRREKLDARIALTREQYAQRKADREMAKTLMREAKDCGQIIQKALMNLGEFYAPTRNTARGNQPGGKRNGLQRFLHGNVQRVNFEIIATSPEIHWYRLKVREHGLFGGRSALPYQVRVADLMKDETTYELAAACERRVSWEYDPFAPERGAWFLVHRLEGTGGIPKHIAFTDMLEHAPDDMGGLSLVIGVGEHRRVKSISMYDSPQWLIAGPTRTGKSNLINALILQLMYHCTPDEVQLVLCDMKEMIEFGIYEKSPYLWQPPAADYETALDTLEALRSETTRRLRLVRNTNGRAKDYRQYNALYPDAKLPAIICIVDEAAQLMNMGSHQIREQAVKLLTSITSVGRAAGVYLIICTQQPTVQVIDSQIKGNLPVRIAFRCTHHTQSGVIIGRGDAAYLPDIKGRCIFIDGPDLVQCQVPYVRAEDIDHVLALVRKREIIPKQPATLENQSEGPALPGPQPAQEVPALLKIDHWAVWREERTANDEDTKTPIASLYTDYCFFCKERHLRIDRLSKRDFAIRLSAAGYENYIHVGTRFRKGIKLVATLTTDDDDHTEGLYEMAGDR